MQKRNRLFAVIGLGTFGSTVATELARSGDHVLGIDTNENHVNSLADTISEAVIADGKDCDALREAGVGNCDTAVVAIGDDLEANIVCTMNVKLLGVPRIWVKARNKTHHRILTKIGACRVTHPEHEIGQHVAQMLHNPLVRDYVSLGNGYHIVDFRVPDHVHGRSIEALRLTGQFSIRCLGVMRGKEFLACESGKTELQTNDKIILLGRRGDLMSFSDSV